MYLTVFRNRKRADMDRAAYEADNARMEELAVQQPGFISIKGFVAEDGEVVAISEWESEVAARAWGSLPRTCPGPGPRAFGLLRELQALFLRRSQGAQL